MKKIMKMMAAFLCFLMIFTTTACKKDDDNKGKDEGCNAEMTLDDLNKMLNDKINMDMDSANHVAVIPFTHINGPKIEWNFYALVNFEYDMGDYVKYQVTYLSCTCRSAEVNYWSTMYVNISKPESGIDDDAELLYLSFERDEDDHYNVGYWGDSEIIYSGDDIVATYDRVLKDENNPSAGYYPSLKYDFIPLLINMKKSEIDQYKLLTDMKAAGVITDQDLFTSASVSTDNILRILHAVFKYHASRY